MRGRLPGQLTEMNAAEACDRGGSIELLVFPVTDDPGERSSVFRIEHESSHDLATDYSISNNIQAVYTSNIHMAVWVRKSISNE